MTSVATKSGSVSGQVYQFASKTVKSGSWGALALTCGGLQFTINQNTASLTTFLSCKIDPSSTLGTPSVTIGLLKNGSFTGGLNLVLNGSYQSLGSVSGYSIDSAYQLSIYDICTRDTNVQVNDGQRWRVTLASTGSVDLVVTAEYWGPNYYG